MSSCPSAGMLPSRQVVTKYAARGMSQWGSNLRRNVSTLMPDLPSWHKFPTCATNSSPRQRPEVYQPDWLNALRFGFQLMFKRLQPAVPVPLVGVELTFLLLERQHRRVGRSSLDRIGNC